jgi:tight adherence protein B
MNATWFILLFTFLGTALLVGTSLSLLHSVFIQYPASLRQRVQELSGKSRREKSLLLDVRQLADSASQAPSDWRYAVRVFLDQSGLRIDARMLLTISLLSAGSMGAATALLSQRWWVAAAAAVLGLVVPWAYVAAKRQARLRSLMRQLPDALDVMCRAVRAGQTVPATFQMVADDFPPPISEEFRYCYEQQNLGIAYETALRNLARGTGIMELRILAVALLVQSRSGGNLTELLQNLAGMVRKRLVLQQKIKVFTGEGRMQAAVLVALPFVVFLAMYVLNREYARILLDHPWLLTGCIASQTAGALMIRKLIRIDY